MNIQVITLRNLDYIIRQMKKSPLCFEKRGEKKMISAFIKTITKKLKRDHARSRLVTSNDLVNLWAKEVEELRNKYGDTTMEFVLNSLLLIAKKLFDETFAEEVKQQMLASSGM